MIFIAFIFSIVWMGLAYLIYLRYNNATIVDLAWTLGAFGVTALYFLKIPFGIKYSVFFAMLLWGLRLALLILYRILRFGMDERYKTLDKSFEGEKKKKYFFFFMFQGISLVILTLPIYILTTPKEIAIGWAVISICVMSIGLLGVITSDLQLQLFKAKKEHLGKVCDKGLWNYSRHPNYFFEWIYWCGVTFFGIFLPYGYLGLISPMALLYILLFVTGIPTTEKQLLASKKEGYKEYQRTTSAFVPWFKKR
jgi:steroid 5-alpha reductase family enzyme